LVLEYLVTATARSGTARMARVLTEVGIPCGHECIFGLGGHAMAEIRLDLLGRGEASTREYSASEYIQRNYSTDITTSSCSTLKVYGNATIEANYLPDPLKIIADSSFMSAPSLSTPLLEQTKIIHLLRNPVKVINSMVNYCGFFVRPLPQIPSNPFSEYVKEYLKGINRLNPFEIASLHWISWNKMITDSGRVSYTHRIEDPLEPLLEFLGKKEHKVKQDNLFNTQMYGKFGRPLFRLGFIKEEIAVQLSTCASTFGYDLSNSF